MEYRNLQTTRAFSQLVRERRAVLGLSQLDLAVEAGVSPHCVSSAEAGSGLNLRNALPLARRLGINLMDLP